MSLHRQLRAIIGPDAIGAIVEGEVLGMNPVSGLTRMRVGRGELHVQAADLQPGAKLRVQILARDIIVATQAPQRLSVRNSLPGSIVEIASDDEESDLIAIDIGGTRIMARITKAATRELVLTVGLAVWALVKAVSLRGRSFSAPIHGE